MVGFVDREKLVGDSGCLSLRQGAPNPPGQHSLHVDIDRGDMLAERQTRNSRSRVSTNSGEGLQLGGGAWPAVLLDLTRRIVQTNRPTVVPQARPGRQHLLTARPCHRRGIGELL